MAAAASFATWARTLAARQLAARPIHETTALVEQGKQGDGRMASRGTDPAAGLSLAESLGIRQFC